MTIGRYTMKNTCKKLSALMLALLMLISAAACTGSGDPADTTGSDTSAPDTGTGTDTQAPDAEAHGLHYMWQPINLSHFSPSLPLLLLLLTLKKILKG